MTTAKVPLKCGLDCFSLLVKSQRFYSARTRKRVRACCSMRATEVALKMVSVDAFRPLQFFNLPSAWAGHVDHIFRILAMIRTGVQPLVSQTTLLLILGCWVDHPIVLDSCFNIYRYIYIIIYT